jgi:hypothetical protein
LYFYTADEKTRDSGRSYAAKSMKNSTWIAGNLFGHFVFHSTYRRWQLVGVGTSPWWSQLLGRRTRENLWLFRWTDFIVILYTWEKLEFRVGCIRG